ncbi:EAL domain-containing protein [Pelagibacterium sp. H642]|uniref:putative bifunctional diguanylate cyclase/phosphodiesterase n=1 Tax=Pelagibacterium sp. H642 TaxID=1881069 RepID=UPI002814979A|nr:EAL domain-containing protein [Pelagibacterium sp. H642]WMT89114.1 EAL domain-containing protein [Pelagibacterium sp. H642]
MTALYKDRRSLFSGTGSAIAAALVTGWMSGSMWIAGCAIPLGLTGFVRWMDMNAYERAMPGPQALAEARRWEKRYILGSSTFAVFLSLWCFLTFLLTQDPAVHLVSFAVCLAYMIGITGRNYASDQLVTFTTITAAVPMVAGLLLQYEFAYVFLALLLVPFFMSVRNIATRLRHTLFDAVVASHDLRALASHFDTAVNNMPHGLCMFDADQRFVVCNERFLTLLGLPTGGRWKGRKAVTLLARTLEANSVPKEGRQKVIESFQDWFAAGCSGALVLEAAGEKILELTFQPIEAGGCVMLVEDISEKRRAEARIEHLARYDALTGLPNRSYFQEQFEAVAARGQACALLFIDLDQFKVVNDTLGHPCGDALLCQVAARLRRVLRPSDVIARFGGDEFVVLRPLRGGDAKEASLTARRIVSALGDVFTVEGHQIVIGASIGIAIEPTDGETFDQVLKNADLALYCAKSDGRGVWRFFEPDMDVRAQDRRALEIAVRDALENGNFEVFFQPIINLKTGQTTVCEALVRWRHAERGMISPAEFIPLAEETNVIIELGDWILHEACRQCASWPGEVGVAVNISPIQFRRGDVVRSVISALERSGLPAHRLELEITESVLMENTEVTRTVLENLKRLGVRISLDDFGTGYASLSYLHHFPLDKVKIDRSFLQDVEADSRSRKLLVGVARLTADLGMSVVVEGVETRPQLTLLMRQSSIEEVQGFLFSPPRPAKDIPSLLEAGKVDFDQVA